MMNHHIRTIRLEGIGNFARIFDIKNIKVLPHVTATPTRLLIISPFTVQER